MIFNGKNRKPKPPVKRYRAQKTLGVLRAERDSLKLVADARSLTPDEQTRLARLTRIIFASEKAILVKAFGEDEYARLRKTWGHARIWKATSEATKVLGKALD